MPTKGKAQAHFLYKARLWKSVILAMIYGSLSNETQRAPRKKYPDLGVFYPDRKKRCDKSNWDKTACFKASAAIPRLKREGQAIGSRPSPIDEVKLTTKVFRVEDSYRKNLR
jgi:hypothetical protein